MLGQLPWHSRYQLALADDDEYQAEILASNEDTAETTGTGSSRPSLRRWSPFDEIQATLVDGFNTLVVAQSGKKKKVKPVPRPETGRDRVKRARDSAEVDELFHTFTPGR